MYRITLALMTLLIVLDFSLTRCYCQTMNAEIIKSLEFTLKKNPSNLFNYLELAKYLLWEKRELEALGLYKKYLARGGKDPAILKKMGELCLWNSRESEAVGYFESYLKAVPGDLEVMKAVGTHFAGDGNHEAALRYLLPCLEGNPHDQEVIRTTGLLYAAMEDSPNALKLLVPYLRKHPDDLEVIRAAGSMYSLEGRDKDALGFIETYIQKKPEDREAAKEAIRIYSALGNHQKALEIAEKYRHTYNDPEISALTARILILCGRHQEGLALYEKLVSTSGWDDKVKEDALRELLEQLRSRDPVTAFETARRHSVSVPARLKFFLYAFLYELYLDLDYSRSAEKFLSMMNISRKTMDKKSPYYASDLVYASQQLIRSGKLGDAKKLLDEAYLVTDPTNDHFLKSTINFLKLKISFLTEKNPGHLVDIGEFARKHGDLPESALFYVQQETRRKPLLVFFNDYKGRALDDPEFLYRKFIAFSAHGIDLAAVRTGRAIPPGIQREKALAVIDPESALTHHKNILLTLDPFDADSAGYIRRRSSREQWLSLEPEILEAREASLCRTRNRLRRNHEYFRTPESAIAYARHLHENGMKEQSIKCLDSFYSTVRKDWVVKGWLQVFRSDSEASPSINGDDLFLLEKMYKAGEMDTVTLADVYYRHKNWEKALALYRKVQDNSYALAQTAQCEFQLGRTRDSLRTIAEFKKRFGNDQGLSLLKVEIMLQEKQYGMAKKELSSLWMPSTDLSYPYFKELEKNSRAFDSARFSFNANHYRDTEDLVLWTNSIEFEAPGYPLHFVSDITDTRVKTDGIEERNLMIRAGGMYHRKRHQLKVMLNSLGLPGIDLIRTDFEYQFLERLVLFSSHEPLFDTPEALQQNLFKRTDGIRGELDLNSFLSFSYRFEKYWLSDGNTGDGMHISWTLAPVKNSPLRFVYEHDRMDYDYEDEDYYYSPSDLYTDSYGFNLSGSAWPYYLSYRRFFTNEKDKGDNIYWLIPVHTGKYRLDLEGSYYGSSSGRFTDGNYKGNYYGIKFNNHY